MWRETLNVLKYSVRVNFEQACRVFGKFSGLFWRHSEFNLKRESRVVCVCALLQKFIFDNNAEVEGQKADMFGLTIEVERRCILEVSRRWHRKSHVLFSSSSSGTRTELVRNTHRNVLVARPRELGKSRPN